MNESTITNEVNRAVGEWTKLQQTVHKREIRFSDGAIDALVKMIVNIAEDPSPHWQDIDSDAVQIYSVSLIQNVLNDIFLQRRSRFRPPNGRAVIPRKGAISSWEIWHGISFALEDWCPLPKDI